MTEKNPKKVFGNFAALCNKKTIKIYDFLEEYKDSEYLETDEIKELNELIQSCKDQYGRMEKEWETQMKTMKEEDQDNINKIVSEQDTETEKAAKAARKFIKSKTAPKTAESTTKPDSSTKVWKPVEHYKPGILNGPKEVSLYEFDDWIRHLRAHLKGHETQDIKEINLIVSDLIIKDVRGSINFEPDNTTPIFSKGLEESIETQLRNYWMRFNPLSKIRSKVFEIQGYKHETFDQWRARAKQAFALAELDKLDKDSIEALIILMRFAGPTAKALREKVVESEDFKKGNIHQDKIAEIAHEMESTAEYNKEDQEEIGQVNKLNGKYDKKKENKKTRHEYLQILSKEGKCFHCANKHDRNQKCNPEKFTCNFCKKPRHTTPACTYKWDKEHNRPDRLAAEKKRASENQQASAQQGANTNA